MCINYPRRTSGAYTLIRSREPAGRRTKDENAMDRGASTFHSSVDHHWSSAV